MQGGVHAGARARRLVEHELAGRLSADALADVEPAGHRAGGQQRVARRRRRGCDGPGAACSGADHGRARRGGEPRRRRGRPAQRRPTSKAAAGSGCTSSSASPAAGACARARAPRLVRARLPAGRASLVCRGAAPKRVEVEIDGRTLSLSNLDKPMYPEAGFAKGHVIDYYTRVSPALLPHLRGRPLTLKRYPDGVEGPHFYEKQCPVAPAAVGADRGGRQQPRARRQDRLLPGRRPADARLAGQPRRPRAAHLAGHGGRLLAADRGRLRPRPGRAGHDRRVRRGGAGAARRSSSTWGWRRSRRPRARRGCRSTCRSNTPATYGETSPFAKGIAELLERAQPEAGGVRDDQGATRGARCSSTGARTRATRRRSASTRCGRCRSRRCRRR